MKTVVFLFCFVMDKVLEMDLLRTFPDEEIPLSQPVSGGATKWGTGALEDPGVVGVLHHTVC